MARKLFRQPRIVENQGLPLGLQRHLSSFQRLGDRIATSGYRSSPKSLFLNSPWSILPHLNLENLYVGVSVKTSG